MYSDPGRSYKLLSPCAKWSPGFHSCLLQTVPRSVGQGILQKNEDQVLSELSSWRMIQILYRGSSGPEGLDPAGLTSSLPLQFCRLRPPLAS